MTSKVKGYCSACGIWIPSRPGRYPGSCPTCGAPLNITEHLTRFLDPHSFKMYLDYRHRMSKSMAFDLDIDEVEEFYGPVDTTRELHRFFEFIEDIGYKVVSYLVDKLSLCALRDLDYKNGKVVYRYVAKRERGYCHGRNVSHSLRGRRRGPERISSGFRDLRPGLDAPPGLELTRADVNLGGTDREYSGYPEKEYEEDISGYASFPYVPRGKKLQT